MTELWTSAHREFVYLWYYFELQFRQIFRYWMIGILIGSCISVFLKDRIHELFRQMSGSKFGVLGFPALHVWHDPACGVCFKKRDAG